LTALAEPNGARLGAKRNDGSPAHIAAAAARRITPIASKSRPGSAREAMDFGPGPYLNLKRSESGSPGPNDSGG
jgi:hypothetical protein